MALKKVPSDLDLPFELAGTNDRSIAVVAGALLETLIENLLRKVLNPSTHNVLFNGYGPLSTFSAKIDVAFAIGVLSATEHADLHRIRRIRNEFAHELKPLSFSVSPLCDHVAQLQLCSSKITGGPKDSLEDFKTCVAILSGFLKSHTENAHQLPTREDIGALLQTCAESGK